MNLLADDVVASINVELSDAAKQQLALVKTKYPNEELPVPVHKAPLKFTTEADDAEWEKYQAIINS